MVDVSKVVESQYVSVAYIKENPNVKAVILNEGLLQHEIYYDKLVDLLVEINGKRKIWSPNKSCVLELTKAFGTDTKLWIGKVIELGTTVFSTGKEGITAKPVI